MSRQDGSACIAELRATLATANSPIPKRVPHRFGTHLNDDEFDHYRITGRWPAEDLEREAIQEEAGVPA